MHTILDNNDVLSKEAAGRIKFDRNKLNMLATRQNARPVLKDMEDSYAYERESYLQSGKTKAVSGSSVHAVHQFVGQNAQALGVALTPKTQAVLNKNVDNLTPRDWEILDELGRLPEVNQSADVIYKKKSERLQMMVSTDHQGKLVDSDDDLFSTRQGQPGIFAMDRYGNLFIEPPDFNPGTNFFNHSSFNSGNAVICAGEMTVENGVLKTINNGSGHYKPTRANLHECVKMLNQFGTDLTQAQVKIYGTNPPLVIAATTFLATG